MEILIVLAVVVFAGLMIFLKEKFGPKDHDHTNTRRPNPINKPQKSVKNDKVIVVNNVKIEYLKKSIQQYCNLHNYPEYLILPRLTIIENLGVVTFPLNIRFDTFCYFINYLKYPHELHDNPEYKPDIRAWCTTRSSDPWIKKELSDKKVMVFIPDWDDEYDNVYLTSEYHAGYKMGFALGYRNKILKKPVFFIRE